MLCNFLKAFCWHCCLDRQLVGYTKQYILFSQDLRMQRERLEKWWKRKVHPQKGKWLKTWCAFSFFPPFKEIPPKTPIKRQLQGVVNICIQFSILHDDGGGSLNLTTRWCTVLLKNLGTTIREIRDLCRTDLQIWVYISLVHMCSSDVAGPFLKRGKTLWYQTEILLLSNVNKCTQRTDKPWQK